MDQDDNSNDDILRFVQPLIQCVECKQFFEKVTPKMQPGEKFATIDPKDLHPNPGCVLGVDAPRVKSLMMVVWHGCKDPEIVPAALIYTSFPQMIEAYNKRVDEEHS